MALWIKKDSSGRSEILGDVGGRFEREDELELARRGGAAERRAFQRRSSTTSIGDRRSDNLARQIAMAPLAAEALLMLDNPSSSSTKSTSAVSKPDTKFHDEIRRQIAVSAAQPKKDSGGWTRQNVTLEPGKQVEISLAQGAKTMVSPMLFDDKVSSGDFSKVTIDKVLHGSKPILVGKVTTADNFKPQQLDDVSSKDPIKILLTNRGDKSLKYAMYLSSKTTR